MTKTKRHPFFAENFELNKTLIIDSQSPHQHQAMDFKTTTTTPAAATATINTPDTDTELPTSDPKSGFRSLSFTNGALKPHHYSTVPLPPPPQTVVVYRECLKNHAASIGGHALDGCGEFFPSPISEPADPTSLKCAACGCHRNFHRRDAADERAFTAPKAILVSPQQRLLPPPPGPQSSSPSPSRSTSPGPSRTLSPHSPPPVSHLPPSFFGTPSQMLLALSSVAFTAPSDERVHGPTNENPTARRKRSRTKFSQEQKDKMFRFADKLGWRMQKSEDKFVQDFCDEVGIGRRVFKVWMHNNKHHLKKRLLSSAGLINCNDVSDIGNYGGDGGVASFDSKEEEDNNPRSEAGSRDQRFYFSNNGSSSSS